MEPEQAKTLAKLFASKFIARPDIMAVQGANGEYRPTRDHETKVITEGFSMQALLDHLSTARTLGHYLSSPDGQVKLFALDIDLEIKGELPFTKFGDAYLNWQECNPREIWMSRQPGPAREVMKYQMRMAAHALARAVDDELGIPVAVSYSGSKGLHVYGFTGLTSSERARKGAQIVLEACNWDLFRGNNFYRYRPSNPSRDIDQLHALANLSIEVYPKQDSMDGKDLGNLLRLPLGVNLKSPRDKSFFIDLRAPMTELVPMDPIEALTTTNIWRYQGE